MKKICMSLSGGMDSVTALAVALDTGHQVLAINFQYDSKHNKYERSAFNAALAFYLAKYGHKRLSADEVVLTEVSKHLQSNLLKSGQEIPEGHYEAESMRQTVVPGRNIIFASVLAGIAWSNDCEEIWLGVHAGDHFIYPDCRPEFIEHMDLAIAFGTDHKVRVEAPFLSIDKAAILAKGLALSVPYDLTRTCYKDQVVACGKCGSCQERLWAFKQNGVNDPLDYETREPIAKK